MPRQGESDYSLLLNAQIGVACRNCRRLQEGQEQWMPRPLQRPEERRSRSRAVEPVTSHRMTRDSAVWCCSRSPKFGDAHQCMHVRRKLMIFWSLYQNWQTILTLKVLYLNLESRNLEKGQLLNCWEWQCQDTRPLQKIKVRCHCPIVINVNCYPSRHTYSHISNPRLQIWGFCGYPKAFSLVW